MTHSHFAPLRYIESPIPRDERRRVLWRDDADADRTATGVTVKRQCWPRGNLVRVLIRLDSDPAGALVPVSPNDLEDLGPAVPRIPPVPEPRVRLRVVPPASFAVIQGGAP